MRSKYFYLIINMVEIRDLLIIKIKTLNQKIKHPRFMWCCVSYFDHFILHTK